MLKSLNRLFLTSALVFSFAAAVQAADVKAGEKVFKKCSACHAVGDGAKNKVGPHLNDVFGRTAGTLDGYKYSKAMIKAGEGGLVWNDETMDAFLLKPKKLIKKTKMAFSGLKKDKDRANIIAYLKTYSADADSAEPAQEEQEQSSSEEQETTKVAAATTSSSTAASTGSYEASKGRFGLGRVALKEEVSAWDIDIRPDGKGLPVGKGTVAMGEPIFAEQCASCHGDFGEGIDRWPVLAGGHDTLTEERPEKTIGSYWPYLSTVYDYIRRAMPFGNARSLSDDEVYALTAYVLYLNDVVDDEEFELSNENFNDIKLPNEANFYPDDRAQEAHYADKSEPCMKDCKPGVAKVLMRAMVLDVTPESEGEGSLE